MGDEMKHVAVQVLLGRGPPAEHWAHAEYAWLQFEDGDLQVCLFPLGVFLCDTSFSCWLAWYLLGLQEHWAHAGHAWLQFEDGDLQVCLFFGYHFLCPSVESFTCRFAWYLPGLQERLACVEYAWLQSSSCRRACLVRGRGAFPGPVLACVVSFCHAGQTESAGAGCQAAPGDSPGGGQQAGLQGGRQRAGGASDLKFEGSQSASSISCMAQAVPSPEQKLCRLPSCTWRRPWWRPARRAAG